MATVATSHDDPLTNEGRNLIRRCPCLDLCYNFSICRARAQQNRAPADVKRSSCQAATQRGKSLS
jgi:hypothetical protein